MQHQTRTSFATVALAVATLLVTACGSSHEKARETALKSFEAQVRWSEFAALLDHIHPEYLREHPINSIEMSRLRQYRVTGYHLKSRTVDSDGKRLRQVVELRLFNRNTALERVIDYRQDWRWDEQRERWLLHSGLPDPSRGAR